MRGTKLLINVRIFSVRHLSAKNEKMRRLHSAQNLFGKIASHGNKLWQCALSLVLSRSQSSAFHATTSRSPNSTLPAFHALVFAKFGCERGPISCYATADDLFFPFWTAEVKRGHGDTALRLSIFCQLITGVLSTFLSILPGIFLIRVSPFVFPPFCPVDPRRSAHVSLLHAIDHHLISYHRVQCNRVRKYTAVLRNFWREDFFSFSSLSFSVLVFSSNNRHGLQTTLNYPCLTLANRARSYMYRSVYMAVGYKTVPTEL